jgi:ribosome biogenesis GTPase
LERYFVQAHSGNIQPIVVLNKADLQGRDEIENIKADIRQRLKDSEIFVTSTLNGYGLETLKKFLIAGKTYCLLGSSGVGKSSIINFLVGDKVLQVNEISDATNKGKHTTTHRELILLDNGAILIDTPGMREVGMTDSAAGIELTFDQISELGKTCKFGDCTHTDEPGCKVLEAVDEGLIAIEELENYKKLERQSEHFSTTIAEKRRKEKSFGKWQRR